jgi:hypothetical protein
MVSPLIQFKKPYPASCEPELLLLTDNLIPNGRPQSPR